MRRLLPLLLFLAVAMTAKAQPYRLYGLTANGGANGLGVLYSILSDGSGYQVLYSFGSGTDGARPWGGLTNALGPKLFGTTRAGGIMGKGTIFSFDTITRVYTKLADFTGTNGASPCGDLTYYNGILYGLAPLGGVNDRGTVFAYDPLAGILLDLFHLTPATGANPYGNITVFKGKLYFINSQGGASQGGTLAVFDPLLNTVTDLLDFPTGGFPHSGMVVLNSLLYGTQVMPGKIFSFDPATNQYQDVHDFTAASIVGDGDVNGPNGLTVYNGVLYGSAQTSNLLGNGGGWFTFDPVAKSFYQIYTGAPLASNETVGFGGWKPLAAPVVVPDGMIVGTTPFGGNNYDGEIVLRSPSNIGSYPFTGANGQSPMFGSLFVGTNASAPAHALLKMYGMTRGGGDSSAGVIFSIYTDGSNFQRLYSFKGGTDGSAPRGSPALGLDTKLYGLTETGGLYNGGTLFAYDTLSHTYGKLADLGNASGYDAAGSLVWYKDRWYGLAAQGGAHSNGTIFSYEPTSGVLSDVYDLTTATGAEPRGSITVLNGLMYFTTNTGGVNNGGVLNVYDPATATATDLYDFPSGSGPWSSLITMNNILYGVAPFGGTGQLGLLYSYDPGNKVFKDVFSYNTFYNGAYPYGLAGFHGLVYGTTANGGKNGNGGTFGYVNPESGGEEQLYAFDYNNNRAAGAFPYGAPIITNDAILMGMASQGGVADSGTIFSYDLHTNTYTKLMDFAGINGAHPLTNSLIFAAGNQILPIRIIRFSGLTTAAGRVLNWTASQPADGGSFRLQRSVDEVNYGTIDSVGAVQGTASYSYTDEVALPGVKVAYYRLKMIDDNQGVSYSNVVALGLGSDGGDSLRLINTVVTGTAFLQYTSSGTTSPLDVRVVGMNGMLWIQQELPVSSGVNSYSIDATALPKGTYVLQAAGRAIKFVRL